ncbi:MAG: SH3 domain-containing protein [Eubacterium sp.]
MKRKAHIRAASGKAVWKRSAVLAVSASMTLAMTAPVLSSPVFAAGSWKSVPASAKILQNGTAVRKSASSSSKKLTMVNKGKTYTVSYEKFTSKTSTKASSRWIYVSSLKGFIRSDLAKVNFAREAAWTSDALRMRKGAGTSFASAGTLQKGAAVTVRERVQAADGSKWYRILYGGKTVYVTADYISFTKPSSSSDSSGNTGKGNGSSSTDKPSGKTAVNPDASSDSASPVLKASGTVKAASAIVRQTPSDSAAKVTTLAKGKKLTITSETFTSDTSASSSKRWFYASNVKGYVRRDQVSISYKGAKNAVVKADGGLNTRKGPGTTFGKTGQAADGSSVSARLRTWGKSGSDGDLWYRIVLNGKSCYVKGSYLTFTSGGTDSGKTDNSGKSDNTGNKDDSTTDTTNYITKDGFPSSYLPYLQALHAAHPTWKFTPVQTNLDWDSAVAQMTKYTGTNTISRTAFPASFFSVDLGCYNYLTDSYTGKDGNTFVAASQKAVKYYMDPRNWLTDTGIFMFQNNRYHAYQDADMVKTILAANSVLSRSGVADMFVAAGKEYNISPTYLAAKAISEQRAVTSMVDGSQGAYNVFNVGASDSASGGASKGIAYAKAHGWTTLQKAIEGGASYIASNYLSNNQDSAYLEHFNVMNGLSKVGSHVYMTAVYGPNSQSAENYKSYSANGALGKALEFDIPVYQNMPSDACGSPVMNVNVDNNYYLKSLSVTANGKTTQLISDSGLSYSTEFAASAGGADSVSIQAAAASRTGASVTGNMAVSMNGESQQTAQVVCTSSSGETRTYTIVISAQ